MQKGDPRGSPFEKTVQTTAALRSPPGSPSVPLQRQTALADLLAGCGIRRPEWLRSARIHLRPTDG